MKNLSTAKKILILSTPLISVPVLYFAAKFLSHYTYLFPPCISYTVFKIHCVGCGMTRSVLALLDGNIALSFRQNPIPILAIIVCIWLYIELIFYVFDKKPPFTILKAKYLWIVLAVVIIYTVLRNIFPLLAPI